MGYLDEEKIMDIQYICYNQSKIKSGDNITVSSLSSPKSLDEFDINVIDLSGEGLWRNTGEFPTSIDSIKDFISINDMVKRKTKSIILYALPQNSAFFLYYKYAEKYHASIMLKDIIKNLQSIISKIMPFESPDLLFENNRTAIGTKTFEADFYIYNHYGIMTKSEKSEKVTTIELSQPKKIYVTTLKISNSANDLMYYVNTTFNKNEKQPAPEWISKYKFADDDACKEAIKDNEEFIEKLEQKIVESQEKLKENEKYKSILYTNGNELENVVIEILEKMIECDLSQFRDEKHEDFLIKKPEYTFIGEIKGVTSNLKNEHISQLENHYQKYIDKCEEEEEKTYQILIINPLRHKDPEDREPINKKQIDLAVRYGCLIVETNTLLKMFELFINGKVSSKQCEEIFINTTGLLKTNHFLAEDSTINDDVFAIPAIA